MALHGIRGLQPLASVALVGGRAKCGLVSACCGLRIPETDAKAAGVSGGADRRC